MAAPPIPKTARSARDADESSAVSAIPTDIPDRYECYELCVQSPRHIVSFLRAVHGNQPRVIHEDFSGTAAVSRYWLREVERRGEGGPGAAVAIDLDERALARAAHESRAAGVDRCLDLLAADVTRPLPDRFIAPDVVFVGNFSIGYLHTRYALLSYLRGVKARLDRGQGGFGGGVFVCDTYGGAAAFKLGGMTRLHPSRGRDMIRYHWVHESADPLTGMVENSISFRVERDGEVVQEWPRAFVYRWRLWSIAELREAMHEAGFGRTEVYKDVNIAPDQSAAPVTDPRELGEDWIVLVVGRA